MKYCTDCGKPLSSNKPIRCKRCAIIFKWSNPDYRRKSVESFKRSAIQNPELRRGRSERAKQQWSGGDDSKLRQAIKQAWKQGHFANMIKAANTPEAKAKQSASMILRWQDPDYIELVTHNRNEAFKRPEEYARKSADVKRRWQNPEFRRKMLDTWFSKMSPTFSKLELQVQAYFDTLGIAYETQFTIKGLLRFYDIFIPEIRLIIEVDGDFWHHSAWVIAQGIELIDDTKNVWALSNDYSVLRLRESDLTERGLEAHTEDGLMTFLNCDTRPVLLRYNQRWLLEPGDEVINCYTAAYISLADITA